MIARAFNCSLVIIALLLAGTASAECKWLGDIKVRKSFDGAKDEQKPGAVSYENPDGADEYYNIDLAFSPSTYECIRKTDNLIVFPTLEYHRSNAAKEVRNASIALKAQYYLGSLQSPGGGSGRRWLPQFFGEISVKRDSANDKTTKKASLLIGAKSFLPGLPGGAVRYSPEAGKLQGSVRFRYYPYLGAEYWRNLAITKDDTIVAPAVDETFGVARVFFEYYPAPRNEKEGWQFTLTWEYRRLFGSSDNVNKSNPNLALGANYYFDPEGHVGIGFEYQNGATPTRNFLDEERSSIALKLKW